MCFPSIVFTFVGAIAFPVNLSCDCELLLGAWFLLGVSVLFKEDGLSFDWLLLLNDTLFSVLLPLLSWELLLGYDLLSLDLLLPLCELSNIFLYVSFWVLMF